MLALPVRVCDQTRELEYQRYFCEDCDRNPEVTSLTCRFINVYAVRLFNTRNDEVPIHSRSIGVREGISMKRFLRYFLYREVYRRLRNAGKDDDSSSSRSLDPNKPANGESSHHRMDPLPVEEGPIESTGELKAVLQQMDPYEFEHFVADLWERMGWDTEVSSAAIDEGVDVIARKTTPYKQTTLIQAKRYGPNTTVGSPDIQQYASLEHQYDGVDKVVVVTTNKFTAQAGRLADRLNVKLIDGDDLAKLVAEQRAFDLVDEYVEFVTTVESEKAAETDSSGDATSERQLRDTTGTEPSSDSTSGVTEQSGPLPPTIWKKAVLAAIPGWLIVFFSITVLPEALWGLLFFTVWLGLPVAIFFDSRRLREYSEWPAYTWAYVLGSLVWFLAVIPAGLYLWRRKAIDERDGVESDDTGTPDTSIPDAGEASERFDTPSQSTADSADRKEAPGGTTDRNSRSGPDSEDVSAAPRANDWMDIEYDGERYYAQTDTSPSDEYTVGYQDGRGGSDDPQPGRVFLFEGDDLRFTTEIARPNACAVANDGTVAVVDWNLDWGDELSGTFHVFDRSVRRLVKHEFDANLGPTAITPDGAYAATSTFNPDCSTYLFDVEAGELYLRHENRHGNVQYLEFEREGDGWMLRLGKPDDDTAYGIDFAGHTIWKSDGLKREEQLERLLDSSEEADLREALDLLEDALDLAVEDYEHRNVAQRLADTHWKAARAVKRDDGVTDEWWRHLDKAHQYYEQTLPRYVGKRGIAKVKRQQGKQHLNDGDEAAARDCFEEITHLEDEYDVQLLTNADERRLEELRSSQ